MPEAAAPRTARRESRAPGGGAAGRLSAWAGAALVVGLVLLVSVASDLVGLVVVGAVLAYLLVPIVDALERRGWARTNAAVAVLLGVLVVITTLSALVVPLAVEQVGAIYERWESGELVRLVQSIEDGIAARVSFIEPGDLGLVRLLERWFNADGSLLGYVPSVLETVGNAVIIPFVLFALLKDGPQIRRRLLGLVPNRYFEFVMTVFYKADEHLGGYLRGQALIAVLVGASTTAGLGLLGVDYYLVLGLVTGLANFVPYVGFFVSAALSIVVSIVTTGGTDQVISVVLLYLVLQTVENIVFQPWITGKNVAMHPVLVLLAILVGGRVAGVLGMALAVPTAAILKVMVVETAVSLRRYHL